MRNPGTPRAAWGARIRRVADWRIRGQKRRAEVLLKALDADPTASAELKAQAKKNLEALTLLEVEISKKRVASIIASRPLA